MNHSTGVAVRRFGCITRCALLLGSFLILASALGLDVGTEAREPVGEPLSPETLFQRVSLSVFIVEGLGPDGKVIKQGSGVVVAPQGVATNRHVLDGAVSIRVRRGTQTWDAIVAHVDPAHDLCQLQVPHLTAPPVPIRSSTTLRPGIRVFAIGAPMGLELTLSEGLISGLREHEGVQIIQTTAPISPGSSGGGLFDAHGRLVGLTTFLIKESQNVNFAFPGELIAALPSYPSELPVTQAEQRKYWAEPKTKEEDPLSRLSAWVLWEHNLSVRPLEEEWNPLSAWETKAECEAQIKLQRKGKWNLNNPPTMTVSEVVKGKEDWLVVKIGKEGYSTAYQWRCLADSVDPRQPGKHKTKEEDRLSRLSAWVLWVYNLSVPPRKEEWKPLSASETKAECEAQKKLQTKDVWNLNNPPTMTVSEAVKGKEDWLIVVRSSGGDEYYTTYQWNCLPEGIDPRKPGQR